MRITGLLFTLALLAFAIPQTSFANCRTDGSICGTPNGEYRIKLPEGQGPHPAVIYLYGSLGNSAEKIGFDNFVRAFTDRGFAVVVPAGLNKRYVGGVIGSGWFLRNSRAPKDRDDTAFVSEVIDDAAARQFIVRDKVLIAGMSNGGFLAWEIACHEPFMAAAYAPVAAGYLGKMPENCGAPVNIIHTHGRSDQIVPLDPSTAWRSGGATMTPLEESLDHMASVAGCRPDPAEASFLEYDRKIWNDCAPEASVEVLIHDGAHTIPYSWYPTVIDWFEAKIGAPEQPSGGATASFKSVGGGATSTLGGGKTATFKSVGTGFKRNTSDGSRFKTARPPKQ